ncbi:MAG TPA: FAD-binding and (Fe-S)-binding domain-containing protein, partial [Candidatus Acidoferrum sp.]|nr:FAD-binding and (Fe-S)-binding domain-containing protein [Candidatus Acidoferrum sp.]
MTGSPAADGDALELAGLLQTHVRGEVSTSARRRAEYASDASNYRVVPQVVVVPRDLDDVLATLAVSRDSGTPITSRGGGTSVAGNAIGPGIVIDFSRHLNRIIDVDSSSRTAIVEPGVVLAHLQGMAAPMGLRFGPDPSTHARATLGGMIGNNACGPHSVAYGRTVDNVRALTVVDGLGRRLESSGGVAQVPGLQGLIDSELEVVRTEFGRFPRQVSGYSLEHLLPERGRNLARALVGSEGTLGVTLEATVELVGISPAKMLVVLGYSDMASAADAVPNLLTHAPLALEGLDARLVDVVRLHKGASAVPKLPRGRGWMMIELGGETFQESQAAAQALIRDAEALDALTFSAGPEASAMWRIREDGAGLAGRTPDGRQAWPGWEDAAVPPAQLGAYLREFEALMDAYGVTGIPYGHFGDGCIHVRVDLPLQADIPKFRAFIQDAARLVVRHGGSCSGEHGDGRSRSELLPLMYSERAIALFGEFKALFDPRDLLNPGVLVRPQPIDADLRRPHARALLATNGFSFAHDAGDFTRAVHRCVGVGKCRADNSGSGGFMCPSYLATKDEKDSTRGRARVLQELTNGSVIADWSSPEVHESLDLCLSCKACASDCPTGIDMAKYKSEVLYRTYKGKRRPASHYSIGWLPRWISLLHRLPRIGTAVANSVLGFAPAARLLLRAGGVDPRRSAPHFATVPFYRQWRHLEDIDDAGKQQPCTSIVLWADTFTNGMNPEVAHAAAAVLSGAGFRIIVPRQQACCGLTWITTGQLDAARTRLLRLLSILGPYAEQGIPIVGLEPSCTAVLRSDLVDLLPGDDRAAIVAGMTRTLAEALATAPSGWTPPDLSGVEVIVQPHCHHHSIMGFAADHKVLTDSGATVTTVPGCCGLAGNF